MRRTHRALRYVAVAALSVAGVVASAAVASATPAGHLAIQANLEVSGTVTLLTPSTGPPTSVTIQPQNPLAPPESVTLTAGTLYSHDGAVAGVAALTIGETVQMIVSGNPPTALTVHIESRQPVFLSGVVTALTPSAGMVTSVTIQPRDANQPTDDVALTTATLFYLGGKSTTAATLALGSRVVLEVTGVPATATVVEIAVPRATQIDGTVTALTLSSGTLSSVIVAPAGEHAAAVTVDVSSSTVYKEAKKFVTVADLVVGSGVQVLASGDPQVASIILITAPRPIEVDGRVTSLSPSTGTPTSMTVLPNGFFKSAVNVVLSSKTLYFQDHASSDLTALLVGSRVDVSASGAPLTATTVHISTPPKDIVIGSVTAVSATTMTLQPSSADATPETFLLTSATSFFSGRRSATVAEVNVGDIVRVSANATAPSTALVVSVRHVAIVGRVTNVVGDVILVSGFDGTHLTVHVTNTTTFQMAGQISNLNQVVAGQVLAAQGPALSGVAKSVNATNVWIGSPDNEIYHFALLQHRFWLERHHR